MGWDEEDKKDIEEINKIVNNDKTSNYNSHETILIYGQPKTGKTYAACSFIENTINKGGKVFYVNTDNGLFRTLKVYFKTNFEQIKKNINYYMIDDLRLLDDVVKKIKQNAKDNDLIVIDLIDDFWEMGQIRFVEDVCKAMNVSFIDYIITAAKEKEKFGVLDATKWNYIKKFDDIVIRNLIITPPCDVIACCSSKDTEVAKVFSKGNEKVAYELKKYDEVGSRPAGQKSLAYKFNTVIYLGELKAGNRFFSVMGDRGFLRNSQKVEYKDNFYKTFSELRK